MAAMIGSMTILTDPSFQGLAISLLFGPASSTLLTALAVCAICAVLLGGRVATPAYAELPQSAAGVRADAGYCWRLPSAANWRR